MSRSFASSMLYPKNLNTLYDRITISTYQRHLIAMPWMNENLHSIYQTVLTVARDTRDNKSKSETPSCVCACAQKVAFAQCAFWACLSRLSRWFMYLSCTRLFRSLPILSLSLSLSLPPSLSPPIPFSPSLHFNIPVMTLI